jgi:hypothetical protein
MLILLVGSGCPADENYDGASDETCGTPEPESLDPFDGGGADPPGEPDRGVAWRSPSSLGDGLVHDSEWELVFARSNCGIRP